MTEARVGLLVAGLSLIVSVAAFGVPFYYQYLRKHHDLRLSILGYTYGPEAELLTVSGAFVNRGTGDEVILDWALVVNERPMESGYTFMPPAAGGIEALSNPYGLSHFVVHHDDALIKRLEWSIGRNKLPGRPDMDQPNRGKKTHVGLRIVFLGKDGQPVERLFYFGAVTEADMPAGLRDGGTAKGTVLARISPRSVNLVSD